MRFDFVFSGLLDVHGLVALKSEVCPSKLFENELMVVVSFAETKRIEVSRPLFFSVHKDSRFPRKYIVNITAKTIPMIRVPKTKPIMQLVEEQQQ